MQFILLRHAEKSSDFENDPPLSLKGKGQAQNLIAIIDQKKLPIPTHLFCSPRVRTKETLSFASKKFNIKIESNPLLDLRLGNESSKDFRLRVQEFLVGFQLDVFETAKEKKVVYLCTHQDWAEEFMSIIECSTDLKQSKYQNWTSGQYMYFEKSDLWHLLAYHVL